MWQPQLREFFCKNIFCAFARVWVESSGIALSQAIKSACSDSLAWFLYLSLFAVNRQNQALFWAWFLFNTDFALDLSIDDLLATNIWFKYLFGPWRLAQPYHFFHLSLLRPSLLHKQTSALKIVPSSNAFLKSSLRKLIDNMFGVIIWGSSRTIAILI